jgi:nicotinate-nucleotide pyrophosphorylase (carboxylating)
MIKTPFLDELVRIAFLEDLGDSDLTSSLLIDEKSQAMAEIISKQEGVICGLFLLEKIFCWNDRAIEIEFLKEDGDRVKPDEVSCRVKGNLRSILSAERVSLNFLGRLSAVSTLTSRFVQEVSGLSVDIMDTRKTTPGFRLLEKIAVKIGGGKNHRFGLYDAILIKENHLKGSSVASAVEKARRGMKKQMEIEVEVTNLKEVNEALEAKADIILLDNFSLEDTREAVQWIGKQAKIEFSGGVNLSNVRAVAETGVRRISVGQMTHSAPNFDFSLLVKEVY